MSSSAYCRLCAQLKPLNKQVDLTADRTLLVRTADRLAKLRVDALVDITSDPLPKTVCLPCCDLLERTSEFVASVEQAQFVLRQEFRKVKQEKSEEEDIPEDYPESAQPESEEDKKSILQLKLEECPSNSDSECLASKKRKKKKKQSSRVIIKTSPVDCSNISNHKEDTWREYKWMCSICETEFETINDLRLHAIRVHSVCSVFKCRDCSRKIKVLNTFIIHVKKHRKHLKYYCYICNEKMPSSAILKLHYTEHEDFNQCNYCGDIFEDELKLKDHVSEFAPVRKRQHYEIPLKKEDVTCPQCDKQFKTHANLLIHQAIHTTRSRDHTCEKCGKTFYSKGSLSSHMLLHDDKRPHRCEICGAMFKKVGHLRSHVGIHGGPRPFSCETCGKSFRLRCQLKSHLIIHTDSMPHTCEYCGKAFRFKTILTQHLRQHTGLKPYVCQHCERDFTNWPNYNKHMKRRHGIDTSKKKHTPEGVFPVNPLTGEVERRAQLSDTAEWKNKIMNKKNKPGRPKLPDHVIGATETEIKLGPIEVPHFPKTEH